MGWKVMLKVLRRSGFVPLLVVAQVVFALVVLVNVGSMLATQLAPVLAPTGVPVGEVLFTGSMSPDGGAGHAWSYARIQDAERAVRAMPGVLAVSVGAGTPFVAGGFELAEHPEAVKNHRSAHADAFAGDHVLKALGLKVVGGRGFAPDDYARGGFSKLFAPPAVLVTQSLADQLFPTGHAVGQLIWTAAGSTHEKAPIQIVGVVGDTLRGAVMKNGPAAMHNVMFMPFQADRMPFVSFMVRVSSAQRAAVAKRLPKVLHQALDLTPGDTVSVSTYESMWTSAMHGHKLAAWMLAAVMATVAIVVLLGIAGLSGFWIQTRLHTLGIRRALGASRASVLRDCLLENALMVGIGAVLGVGVGLLVAAWLHRHFALDVPSSASWVAGVVAVFVFGQLAVWSPARRASRVPPVVATRSV